MDLIERQAAIDAMSESLKRVFPEHRQIAEKCLNVLPSAQPEQRWIPCSERLPDEFEVLCCDDRGNMLIAHPFECGDSDTGYSAESEECYMYNVVAWMPLPEPYRGERTEE